MSLSPEHRPGARSWKALRVLEALEETVRGDPGIDGERALWAEIAQLVLAKLASDRERERASLAALERAPHEPLVRAPYRFDDWAGAAWPAAAKLAFLTSGRAARPDGSRGLGLFAGLCEGLAGAPDGDALELVSRALRGAATRMTSPLLLERALGELGRLALDDAADIDEASAWLDLRLARGPFGGLHAATVEALARALAPRDGERVLDVRAGDGRFLASAAALGRDLRLLGDEPAREPFLVLALRLALCDARIGAVEAVDVLDRPPFELAKAELVLGVAGGPRPERAERAERAPEHDPALADLDRALRRLAPGGRLALVVPTRMLTLPAGLELRRRIVETLRVRAIVHLPDDALEAAGGAAVLVLEGGGPTEWIDVRVPARRERGREREEAEALLAFLERNAAGLAPEAAPAGGGRGFRVPVDEVLCFDTRGALVACDLDLRRAGDVEHAPGSGGLPRALPVPRTRAEIEPPLVVRPELVGRKRGALLALLGLAAWILWAWLWLPLVTFAAWVAGFELFGEQNALDPTPYVVFLVGWFALMGLVSLGLCTWSAYNRLAFGGENDRRHTRPELEPERQAERAGVPHATLRTARGAKRARFSVAAAGGFDAVEPLG